MTIGRSVGRPVGRAVGTPVGLSPLALSIYAANGFSPEFVADFSASNDDYFRTGGATAVFSDLFTADSEAGGLCVMRDASGNAVWNPHNLLAHSDDIDSWTKTNVTVTSNTTVSPTGEQDADTIVQGTGTDTQHRVTGDATASASKAKFVAWVKYVDWQYINFLERDGSNGVVVDLINGTLGSGSSLSNKSIVADSGGWLVSFDVPDFDFGPYIGFNDGATYTTALTGDGSSSFILGPCWVYRSDLGGMADVPSDERAASALNKYVPTTTAARYLLRRRSHWYDSGTWRPTIDREPVAATNSATYSRDFSQWSKTGAGSATKNATGIDGVASSAYTLSDTANGAITRWTDTVTVPDDSNPACVSFHVAKDASPSTYPGIGAALTGGTTTLTSRYTVDPSDGSVTLRSGDDAATATYLEDVDSHWRITLVITNNGTGNTTLTKYVLPAVNTDGSATWAGSTQGSRAFDQVDVILNQSVPSSPIITNGSAVTRPADTLTAKAAALPYSSVAISMAVQGRYDFASFNAGFVDWFQDGSNRALLQRLDTGLIRFFAEGAGTASTPIAGTVAAGVGARANTAGRWAGGSATQAALNGTAGTADASSVPGIPDLSNDDASVSTAVNGQIDTIRLWGRDIETDGIEEATA